jgi:cytochrome c biogenesis protein ResB
MRKKGIVYLVLLILVGCAPTRVAYKTEYDFSRIRSVGVVSFTSEKAGVGTIVRDEFVRQLVSRGIEVKMFEKLEEIKEVDVALTGTVTQYLPDRKYLVYLGPETAEQTIYVSQPIEVGSANVYGWGGAFGVEGESQILLTNATVGVSAQIVDLATGEVVWANSYSYEGLDIQSTTERVVSYLLRSLEKVWPEMAD